MKIAEFIGKIVERRTLVILILALMATGLAVWSVLGITLVTSQEAFISAESETYKGYQTYEKAFGGDSLIVLVPGSPEELTSPEALAEYTDLRERLTADPRIRSVISPLVPLAWAADTAGVDVATPGFALQAAFDNGTPRAEFTRFFPEGHAMVVARLAGGLTTDQQTDAAEFIQESVAQGTFASGAVVAGMPRIIGDVKTTILSDLARTGLIAVVLMIVILFVVFPARWRLLSIPLVLLGVLWTFGIGTAVGIPLTLVTLAGLPILIGLGVDFAVQFHNRYEEEMRRGRAPAAAIVTSVSRIAPAVAVAVAVMVLGFVTLLISSIPAVREFGVLLAIGAVVLYAGSLFVLNAALYRIDRKPRTAANGAGRGFLPWLRRQLGRDWLQLGSALPTVARWARRHALWVVLVAVILAAAGFAVDGKLGVQTDIEKLIPSNTPGVVAVNEVRDVVGPNTELPFLVQAQDVTDPTVLQWMADFQARALAAHPELAAAESLTSTLSMVPGGADSLPPEAVGAILGLLPSEIRDSLITEDKTGASVIFIVKQIPVAELNEVLSELVAEAEPPEGVTLIPGGTMTLTARTVEAMTENRGLITGIGIAVVLVGLLLIYRNWRRALIAVIPIALVTGWSSGLMYLAGVDLNPLTAVLGALVIAIGTEFTVLLLSRYWEERATGIDHNRAMQEAMGRVGQAITASALTVAAGFGALIFSAFPVLRDLGIVVVVDVVFALIVTVTVVPALVRWLDR